MANFEESGRCGVSPQWGYCKTRLGWAQNGSRLGREGKLGGAGAEDRGILPPFTE